MKPRQELICWNCDEQFSVPLPEDIPANLTVYCPYCKVECVIDFEKLNESTAVYRGGESKTSLEGQYQLPEIMDTKKPE